MISEEDDIENKLINNDDKTVITAKSVIRFFIPEIIFLCFMFLILFIFNFSFYSYILVFILSIFFLLSFRFMYNLLVFLYFIFYLIKFFPLWFAMFMGIFFAVLDLCKTKSKKVMSN